MSKPVIKIVPRSYLPSTSTVKTDPSLQYFGPIALRELYTSVYSENKRKTDYPLEPEKKIKQQDDQPCNSEKQN